MSGNFNAARIVSIALSVFMLSVMCWVVVAWRQQLADRPICQVNFLPLNEHNGNIEIHLAEQDPNEPTYRGSIFVNLFPGEYSVPPPVALRYQRSRVGSYGASVGALPLVYDAGINNLRTKDFERFDLVTLGRVHRWFPFDQGKFEFTLAFEPAIKPHVFRVASRVPGFISRCETLNVNRRDDGSYWVKFEIARSPLTIFAATVLCLGGTVFVFLIPMVEEIQGLATAVASYFFSLWSIRQILSSEMRIFPTVLDCYILTLCAGMIVLVIRRIAKHWLNQQQEPRIYLP